MRLLGLLIAIVGLALMAWNLLTATRLAAFLLSVLGAGIFAIGFGLATAPGGQGD